MTEIITLRSGDLSLAIAPDIGGSITHLYKENDAGKQHIMRPAQEKDIEAGYVLGMACYPLDYSNRVVVPFSFRGETVNLAPNLDGVRWPIHGRAWLKKWDVVKRTDNTLVIKYRHEAEKDGWPWAYEVVQDFTLFEVGLTHEISLINLSDRPQPCSLGVHPFFPSLDESGYDLGAKLTVDLKEIYETDGDLIPTGVTHAVSAREDFYSGRLIEQSRGLDDVFVGWKSKEAQISWEAYDFKLRINADNACDHAVIFTPEGERFFCFEPVSATTNSIYDESKFSETGARVLEPGELFRFKTVFTIT